MATLSVAGHEGCHQFLAMRMRHRLPMWLEEGLCVNAEGYSIHDGQVTFTPARNPSRFNDLRAAIVQGRWIPLKTLLPMDSGDAIGGPAEKAVGYYGQLWALVLFIRSQPQYRAGLAQLLDDAEAGRIDRALKAPPQAFGKLARRGRRYNRRLSVPIFRHYISKDIDGFEREYLSFAKKLAGL